MNFQGIEKFSITKEMRSHEKKRLLLICGRKEKVLILTIPIGNLKAIKANSESIGSRCLVVSVQIIG